MTDKIATTKAQEKTEPATAEQAVETKPKPSKKKKSRRSLTRGQVHVLATFNNTIVTITDEQGNVIATASAGSAGFRGSKKGTAYAAQVAAEKAVSAARQLYGMEKADFFILSVWI